MRFTDAQQAAIEADNRELLVSAAAGSGKTAVLVERILYMIQNRGMSVDRMLVVTFTRAAASELRERLELRLAEAAQQNPKLHQQAELVSNAQISTIHAFCQKVVRQNFQHCEIDPQFTLTDEATRARLYGESLNEVLDRLYKNAKTDADLASLVRKFTERELCAIVDSLYAFLLSRPNPMAWLQAHTSMLWDEQTLDAHPLGLAFCAEAKLMLAGIFAAWASAQELTTDAAFPQPYLATLRSDGETINELSKACEAGLTQLGNTLGGLKFVTLARFKPDVEQEAKLAQAFKDERERYKGMVKELKALLPADCEQGVRDMKEMQAATRGLEKLLCDFHKDFSARKLENTVLDFNDLEHMTLSVLQNEPLRQQQSQLFDALFVDEYQDVSALQEAILNGLKRAPQHGSKQYVFYVGDVKQSIYRFRSAEPTLFLRKQQAFSALADAPCRRIVLNRNFRSRTGVLDAVNRVFSHVMDSRVTEIDYDDDARLYPGTPSERDPQTELHVLNSSGHKPVDMVRAEAGIIARDIQATKDCPVYDAAGKESGTLHYRDIAILLPVSKGVSQKVEEELARAGIPVYCENGADSLKSDEIVQLVQHLMLMDNLMNDLALLSELRGPIFEMTEAELSRIRLSKPEREASFFAALLTCAREGRDMALRTRCSDVLSMLEQERFLYSSMPLAEYLWDFLTRSGLYVHYGAQPGGKLRQANLRMLCHQAGEYEKNHADGLRGFLETVTATQGTGGASPTVINPWEDVVRIMTIHKSKGLEFPVVYVMGMGGALRRRSATKLVSAHGEIGYGLSYVNERARTKRGTLLQSAIELRTQKEERAERARVLYVAMTRAKNRLVLLGSTPESNFCYENAETMLSNGYNHSADALSVRAAHSMLDWLIQSIGENDIVEDWGCDGFPTERLRKIALRTQFATVPTCFPHKEAVWRVVFHSDPMLASNSDVCKPNALAIPLLDRLFEEAPAVGEEKGKPTPVEREDPIAPMLALTHRPLKLGVTALCRALEEAAPAQEEEETTEVKRQPLGLARPRLLSSLPELPAFMQPAVEERAALTGTETHRLLEHVALERVRMAAADEQALQATLREEVARLTQTGIFTPTDAALCDQRMVAQFFQSELGRRTLHAERVMREWSFILRVSEPMDTVLQGVIDLCFLEQNAWVLVDFKTDRVQSAQELLVRYRRQLSFYRQALTRTTPHPVRECALFSLRLGKAATLCGDFDEM